MNVVGLVALALQRVGCMTADISCPSGYQNGHVLFLLLGSISFITLKWTARVIPHNRSSLIPGGHDLWFVPLVILNLGIGIPDNSAYADFDG